MHKIIDLLKEDLHWINSYPSINLSDINEIDYNTYWEKRGIEITEAQKQRADIVSQLIEEDSFLIDFGSGNGEYLNYIRKNKKVKILAIENSEYALKTLASLGIESRKIDITDLTELNKLPETDYILGLEIFEHFQNPEKIITLLRKKARKGIIISFPNTGYYVYRLRLLFGRFPCQWIVHPGEHVRFWTVKDTIWWAKFMKLDLKKIIIYKGIPFLNKVFPSLFGKGILIFFK